MHYKLVQIIFFIVLCTPKMFAQDIIHFDLPFYANHRKQCILKVISSSSKQDSITLKVKIKDQHSIFDTTSRSLKLQLDLKSQVTTISVDSLLSRHKRQNEIDIYFKYFNKLPCGRYHLTIENEGVLLEDIWQYDSTISLETSIAKVLQNTLSKTIKNPKVIAKVQRYVKKAENNWFEKEVAPLLASGLAKEIEPGKGITSEVVDNKVHFYVSNLYMGYIKINSKTVLSMITSETHRKLNLLYDNEQNSMNTLINTINTSLVKKYKDKKDKNISKGKITSKTFISNEQYELSTSKPVFSELTIQSENQIFGIPVTIDALLSTQDINRQQRLSYFKVGYNLNTLKEDAQDIKKDFEAYLKEKQNKIFVAEQLAVKYQEHVTQQKDISLTEIEKLCKELNIINTDSIRNIFNTDTLSDSLRDSLLSKYFIYDSTNLAMDYQTQHEKYKNKFDNVKHKTDSIKEALQHVEQKMAAYQAAYNKMKDAYKIDSLEYHNYLSKLEKPSLQDLSSLKKDKLALLKEKKLKRIKEKLTNLEIGTINKSLSEYTLNGQLLTGAALGVEHKKMAIDVQAGRLKFIERSNTISQYYALATQVGYEYYKQNKLNITLLTYKKRPTTNGVSSGFNPQQYINAVANNMQNTNIVALTHSGSFFKIISLESEMATNFANSKTDAIQPKLNVLSYMAQKHTATAEIKKINGQLGGSIEYTGSQFSNDILPLLRKNTTIISAKIKGAIGKDYLHYDLSYNSMQQVDSRRSAKNNRLGIELKSTSKRYPNFSISYRPFSNFQLPDDTLITPARQVLGSVLFGKFQYRYKAKNLNHQWQILLNRNVSNADSLPFFSAKASANYTLASKKGWSGYYNFAYLNTNIRSTSATDKYANTISFTKDFKKYGKGSTSQEVAINRDNLLSKWATDISYNNVIKKYNIDYGVSARYMHYLDNQEIQRNIFAGVVTITYTWDKKTTL